MPPQPVQDFLVPAIAQYYAGKEEVERDACMRSCGLAGQTLMISFMIAIGKGTKESWPRPGQLEHNQVVFQNGF